MKITVSILDNAPSYDMYLILGDEYLSKYKYMSRTALPEWEYLQQTPCIHRFSPKPEREPTEYRVNVYDLEQEHIRINNYDGGGYRRCWNYLFAIGTAYFNNVGYPKMLYAFMANNIVRGIEIVTIDNHDYLKFETLKPTSNTTQMSYQTHPHFVHRWDLVYGKSKETTGHTNNTPRGVVYNFLVTNEGYAFIPKEFVVKK